MSLQKLIDQLASIGLELVLFELSTNLEVKQLISAVDSD